VVSEMEALIASLRLCLRPTASLYLYLYPTAVGAPPCRNRNECPERQALRGSLSPRHLHPL
jgi:hypothetical protein